MANSDMANSNNFAAQMDVLRQSYWAGLTDKLVEIEQVWQHLQQQWDEAELALLHRAVHNLVGSGATYGLTRLSEAARPLDILLAALEDSHSLPTATQQTQFATLFAALKEALNHPDAVGVDGAGAEANAPQQGSPDQATPLLDGVESPLPFKHDGLNQGMIFLVSDNATLTHDLELQISYFNYQVRSFSEISDLAKAIFHTRPAAIIVDLVAANGDLIDTQPLNQIKQSHDNSIPIVFISSRADIMTRLRAVRAGGDAYFTTPVDVGELIDQLDVLTAHQTPEPYHILIVEDDVALAEYYSLTLQDAGMIASAITDPLQVLHALSEFRPDLILMDVYMPECSGAELATVIRQQEDFVSIPIVFLSGETDLNKQMAAMSQGGDDFLTKPIKPTHLVAAVTSRSHRSRVLRSLMVRDSLTGLFNHTATKEQLDIALARARRSGAQLTFAMLDIDKFKSVNDTYGHAVGDRVIKSLSRLLQQRLRKTDIVGRYGGEEFAAVLVDTNGPAALQVLDEVRAHFSQIRHQSETEPFTVTFSCGVATAPPWLDSNELADAADKALYEAKHQGRNRVVMSEQIVAASK